MKRLYQYIDIPGKELRREGKHRDKSKFWNEGKWNTFINPLIPEETLGLPFLEVGSNSGLFLKMAEEKGFRHVIGVEGEPERVITADWYRDSLGAKFKTIPQYVDSKFDWNQLPRTGVTLLANMHYYMFIPDFAEMVHQLRDRTLYCIVVSAAVQKNSGMVSPYINQTRGYFKDWTEVGVIENIGTEGDLSPREGMYGIIFKSPLKTIELELWYQSTKDKYSEVDRYMLILNATEDFYRNIHMNSAFDVRDSELYNYHITRISKESAYNQLQKQKELFEDVRNNGIKRLMYFTGTKVRDGVNRCMIARELGYKRVIIKDVGYDS